jgi:hypothetical protein
LDGAEVAEHAAGTRSAVRGAEQALGVQREPPGFVGGQLVGRARRGGALRLCCGRHVRQR